MTTYRVGRAGATVFNAHGEVVGRLPPGHVVVEGVIDMPGSLAEQHRKLARKEALGKRLKGYADKMLRVAEDKAT